MKSTTVVWSARSLLNSFDTGHRQGAAEEMRN